MRVKAFYVRIGRAREKLLCLQEVIGENKSELSQTCFYRGMVLICACDTFFFQYCGWKIHAHKQDQHCSSN